MAPISFQQIDRTLRVLSAGQPFCGPDAKFFSSGSGGGKWQNTKFFYHLMESTKHLAEKEFEGRVLFSAPLTSVVGTDLFKEFMDLNDLWASSYANAGGKLIVRHFLNAKMPPESKEIFHEIACRHVGPIAIRSSAQNEDSDSGSYAGIYYSIFLPNIGPESERIANIEAAAKLVYSSIYLGRAIDYTTRITRPPVGDERMALLIQDVAGKPWSWKGKNYFSPLVSFVGISFNEYAHGMLNAEDGFYRLCLGLGIGVVEMDFQTALRANIGRPQLLSGLSDVREVLEHTPRYFYALDLDASLSSLLSSEEQFVRRLGVFEDAPVQMVEPYCRWYDEDGVLRHVKPLHGKAYPALTFDRLVSSGKYSLTHAIAYLRDILRDAYESEVDFEGSADRTDDGRLVVHLLQSRPLVRTAHSRLSQLPDVSAYRRILHGEFAVGAGKYSMRVVVWVPYKLNELYGSLHEVSAELSAINQYLSQGGENSMYLLIVPGRFGNREATEQGLSAADGIPGDFNTISHAAAVVEHLSLHQPHSSQGTHFFNDVVSVGMAYLYYTREGQLNVANLLSLASNIEDRKFARILYYDPPLQLLLDKKGNYVIYQPEE
jgi:hypothetical protein